MKKIIWSVLLILLSVAVLGKYDEYESYVTDRVQGRNMNLVNFIEPTYLLEPLFYNDMVKQENNKFSGSFEYGMPLDLNLPPTMIGEDVSFNGYTTFDDKSKLKYQVTGFVPEYMEVDIYGNTIAQGRGVLVYDAIIVIHNEVPVYVDYIFYQDTEDKSNYQQEIYIENEDKTISMELEGDTEKNSFMHNRKCYTGCD